MQKGFTLIEVLIAIGIITILASVVLIAINPARQFAQARDTERISHLTAIINAIGQRIVDNKGTFEKDCSAGAIPSAQTVMKSTDGYNILPCLTPTYLSAMPFDPKTGSYVSDTEYNTGYTIMQNPTSGRITVTAPNTELTTPDISITR